MAGFAGASQCMEILTPGTLRRNSHALHGRTRKLLTDDGFAGRFGECFLTEGLRSNVLWQNNQLRTHRKHVDSDYVGELFAIIPLDHINHGLSVYRGIGVGFLGTPAGTTGDPAVCSLD